jgi:hypothetical protein
VRSLGSANNINKLADFAAAGEGLKQISEQISFGAEGNAAVKNSPFSPSVKSASLKRDG